MRTDKIVSFLGLNQSMIGLLCMVILVGLGEKMAERFLPIYMLALGGGALSVGILNGLDNLLSALYSLPGGYLSDRFGFKRALLIFNLMAMAGFTIVILIPSWTAVILGAALFLSWTAISLPASMSLVAEVLPQNKRTMGVSMHSLVRRVPMALGPIIGGLFIGAWGEKNGVRMAFLVALVLAGVAVVMQQKMIKERRQDVEKAPFGSLGKRAFASLQLMRPALKNLLIADILIRFCEQVPYAFVVIWCMKTIASPVTALQFGVLTTVEMVTALLIYVPVASLADRSSKKPFVLVTFGFFTLFPLFLLFCQSFWLLVGAFILRGLKEFGEPTRKALILDLAPGGSEASAFGVYYLLRDSIVSLAAFGGAFLWLISPQSNFLTAFACGIAGTAWFAIFGKDTAF